jgi:hypothetical protein
LLLLSLLLFGLHEKKVLKKLIELGTGVTQSMLEELSYTYIYVYIVERERERCARTPSKIAAAAAVVVSSSSSSSSSSSVPSLRSQILLEYALFPFSHNQLLRSNE